MFYVCIISWNGLEMTTFDKKLLRGTPAAPRVSCFPCRIEYRAEQQVKTYWITFCYSLICIPMDLLRQNNLIRIKKSPNRNKVALICHSQ